MTHLSQKALKIRELVHGSSVKIYASKDQGGIAWMCVEFHGLVGKLPSTTNNRLLTVPRQGILLQLGYLISNPGARTTENLQKLWHAVKNMRATYTKNPDQVVLLEAMTTLYRSASRGDSLHIRTGAGDRALVCMFNSPLLNRHDSHNIPKAVCDWLQEVGIVSNDKYVDVFPLRKTDWKVAGEESEVWIFRSDVIRSFLFGFVESIQMLKGDRMKLGAHQQTLESIFKEAC